MAKFDVPAQSSFWVNWKNVSDNLSMPIHGIIIVTFLVFYFESEKSGREREEIQKCNILRTKRAFRVK